MRKPLLLASAALAVAAPVALAQEADTTPPTAVIKISTTLQSLDSLIGNGLVFSADPSEDMTYTAKATLVSGGKKVVVAKSIREGDLFNSGGGFVEQSLARGSDSAVRVLQKIKKGKKLPVTLTLKLKDTAGNTKTVTKTVKLKKRY